jgi:tetratricopeptide (TPR) repeat protein
MGIVAVLASIANAEPRAEADLHARRGVALYNLGKYEEAIDEFEDAYKAFQSDALLFNLAQAHRKLEHCDRALTYYHQYLAGTPTPALAQQVEKLLPDLEAACRTRDAHPDGPVTPAAAVEPVAVTAAVPVEVTPTVIHVGVDATIGEIISGGNAPITGVVARATWLPPWFEHTELGLAAGIGEMFRYDATNNTAIAQLGAVIEMTIPFSAGRWTIAGELGAEHVSLTGDSRDVVPGVGHMDQWAPLVRGELGIEHDISPLFAVRAAAAVAVCPRVGDLEAAIGELDLVVGLRYAP